MSENVAVPLSAATTRYGSSPSWRTTSGGGVPAPVADVVGQVEQAADERPVAGDDLVGQRLAVRRRPLDHEAALGADGHDQRVLDHLRLHQAEDLRAEVLAAVRPAQPAAGDRAAAQVHALDARRVDEDLEARARSRQQRDPRGVELEAR